MTGNGHVRFGPGAAGEGPAPQGRHLASGLPERRVVITRMSWHPPTRAYVERRSKEGLSKPEIIRCLKRYVARETYRHLRAS
jgi:hypothetical protein